LVAAKQGVSIMANVECPQCGTRIGSLTSMSAGGSVPPPKCPRCGGLL
jgi:hypothetical protein